MNFDKWFESFERMLFPESPDLEPQPPVPVRRSPFEQAAVEWSLLPEEGVELQVWRYADITGRPRPNVTLCLVRGQQLIAGVNVRREFA